MLLQIDFQSDVPIYIQLKQQIIEGIAKGNLKEGESLPSVRQLAEDIGINLHTVNKAYTLLKNDSFILMDRRKGAVVNTRKNMTTDNIKDKLIEDITPIIAEAFCKGIKEEDLIEECSKIFRSFSEEQI
jgi:GntR family transcriptional regulator